MCVTCGYACATVVFSITVDSSTIIVVVAAVSTIVVEYTADIATIMVIIDVAVVRTVLNNV